MGSFQALEDLGTFEDGKVDGIALPEARLQFLSTATLSSVQASSIFSLVELWMPKVELAFERSSKLQQFWLMLLRQRKDLANFQTDDFDKHEVAFIIC